MGCVCVCRGGSGLIEGWNHLGLADCSRSPDLLLLQTMPLLPLNRLAPRLRRSVEGLNLELEEVFVSEKSDDQHEVRPLSPPSCAV